MPEARLDPFGAAVVTALVSCGALALAVAGGWLGTVVGEGSLFCEALRDGLVNQPANTWSNLAFVAAGLLVGWRARRQPTLMDGLAGFYACVVVLLGPASAAMHATGTEVGKHLDLTSMFLVGAFAAAYGLKRWAGWGRGTFVAVFVALLVVSEAIYLSGPSVPVVLHAGNAMFALLLIVAVTAEVTVWRRRRSPEVARAGVAALATMLVAFVIWNLDQGAWCRPDSLVQGHAIWHVLCAVAAYQLFRVYAADSTAADVPQNV